MPLLPLLKGVTDQMGWAGYGGRKHENLQGFKGISIFFEMRNIFQMQMILLSGILTSFMSVTE